jgi:hypothetical protein
VACATVTWRACARTAARASDPVGVHRRLGTRVAPQRLGRRHGTNAAGADPMTITCASTRHAALEADRAARAAT